MHQHLLVITTMPDAEGAQGLARALVEARLAGCVNISAPVTSIYEWQGRIETGSEVMLTIKSPRARYPEIERFIVAHHPYELPEVIAVPITEGSPDYLKWIDACTRS